MIATLRYMLNEALAGRLASCNDDNVVIRDVQSWLSQNELNSYNVYLIWNAIRTLFATGMKEASNEDVEMILMDPRSSAYFVDDRMTEMAKIKSLANMFQRKWSDVVIQQQIVPFDCEKLFVKRFVEEPSIKRAHRVVIPETIDYTIDVSAKDRFCLAEAERSILSIIHTVGTWNATSGHISKEDFKKFTDGVNVLNKIRDQIA